MVSQEAVDAIKHELRKAKKSEYFPEALKWRRKQRKKLRPLLSPHNLVARKDGKSFAGLREVLKEPGGPSDSSRVIGRVRTSPRKVRNWCSQLLNTSAEPSKRLAVTQDDRYVLHLGRNTFSVLLHLKEPGKFGYVNGTVENALRNLGEWPRFSRGLGQGDKYLEVNAILIELAERVGLNAYKGERLAALDQLLYYYSESGKKVVLKKKPKGRLAPDDPDKSAEISALEGGKNWVGPHLTTERNSRAAAKFKDLRARKYPDLECEVCGFSFRSVYGDLGKGFIEAHHRKKLSARSRRRRSTKRDFDFVCSNCHRMLHKMEHNKMDKRRLRDVVRERRQAARSAVDLWWKKQTTAHR